MHPKGNVKIFWSRNFAYAIGLLASDGCLSNDGRHITLTSKDDEQISALRSCLGLKNKIGRTGRGGELLKKYFRIQFGDRIFYDFLVSLGLHPTKSKTLTTVKVPDKFFLDFFRGCIDGDGTIGAFKHPESKHLQLRLRLASASPRFLPWMLGKIRALALEVRGGWVSKSSVRGGTVMHYLVFGKSDSVKLLRRMYNPMPEHYLQRKYKIVKEWMGE
jgi:hypothetical protein